MARPKKVEGINLNVQENMTLKMLADSLARYEKTMCEFIPLLNNLLAKLNYQSAPVVQNITAASEPITLVTPSNFYAANDLSDKQIWYFTTGAGANIPSDFIKRSCNKEKWQDLTREQAIKLIGEWKTCGEKAP